MATLLLASKWEALVELLKTGSDLVELARLLREGDAGTWLLVGVAVTFAILIFALRRWHGVVIFRWPWGSLARQRKAEASTELSAADRNRAPAGSDETKPSEPDLVLEKAIVRWTTAILLYGLFAFVVAVCVQGWIWIEQSAWPLRARVAPISHLSFNATANMRMGQWHGDAIELKNTTSKKMHIKHVVVNGEHELKFRIDVLNRIVPAGLVTIEPNSSATWYLRGDPPFRPWLDIPVWFPIPMHRSRGAESSDVEAEVQKERERRAAEARAKAAQTRQQQLDEDLRVAASAFRNSVTSVDIDVNGKTIHLKVQDRP
jgi:hypothetical protein